MVSKIPEPNVDLHGGDEWTEDMIRGILCNPLYAGMGDFPRIVEDDVWVATAVRAIEQDGLEQWLVNMLHTLRTYLPAGPSGIRYPPN